MEKNYSLLRALIIKLRLKQNKTARIKARP